MQDIQTQYIIRLDHTIIGPFDHSSQARAYATKIGKGKVEQMFQPFTQLTPIVLSSQSS